MGKKFLKNIGKIIFFTFFFATSNLFATEIEARLYDSLIAEGERTQIVINLIGDNANYDNIEVPNVSGLEIVNAGKSSNIQIINGNYSKSISLTYIVQAEEKGKYLIPPFKFEIDGKILRTKSFKLNVKKGSIKTYSNDTDDRKATIAPKLSLSSKKVFLGEPIVLRFNILSFNLNYEPQGFKKQPVFKSFLTKEIEEDLADEEVFLNGQSFIQKNIKSLILIPTVNGKHQIKGGKFVVYYNSSDGFFGTTRSFVVNYEDLDIFVDELPEKNSPKNFTGSVGNFNLDISSFNKNVELYNEIKIPFKIKGSGNFLSIGKPFFENIPSGLNVIVEEGKVVERVENEIVVGEKSFVLSIIPKKRGSFNLGAFTFNFFNPKTKEYKTVKSRDIKFEVNGEIAKEKKDNDRLNFDESKKNSISFNPIYIFLILSFFILAFFVFIFFERKRFSVIRDISENNKEEKDDVEVKEKKIDYLELLKKSVLEKDNRNFLKSSDLTVKYLLDSLDPKISEYKELEELKHKLDLFGFGGASVTDSDMIEIAKKLERLLKL